MSRRGMVVGLVALAAVLSGGSWMYFKGLREEAERHNAERLSGPPVRMELTGKPKNLDGTPVVVPMIPAKKIEPTLAGKVLRAADDSPIDAAVVEVLGAPGPDGAPAVLARTNSVPDGGFAFTAPDLAPTALRVWVPVHYRPAAPPPSGHAGFQLGQCVVQTTPVSAQDARKTDFALRIDTGWILEGRVTDAEGKPVTNGSVEVSDPHEMSPVDAEGRYLLRDLPPDGKPLTLIAAGDRVRTATIEAKPAQPGSHVTPLDIRLAPAGMIYGRVTWRRGLNRPSNPPVIQILNPPQDAIVGSGETRTALVDGDQNYKLDGLGPGSWDLRCSWTTSEGNKQRTWVTYARGVKVEAGERVVHEFLLPCDATVDIKVTDAAGKPLADRVVEVAHVLDPLDPQSPVLLEARMLTGPNGTCALDELAPGAKELTVMTNPPLPMQGQEPVPPTKLATQRIEIKAGVNPVTVVAGGN